MSAPVETVRAFFARLEAAGSAVSASDSDFLSSVKALLDDRDELRATLEELRGAGALALSDLSYDDASARALVNAISRADAVLQPVVRTSGQEPRR